MARPQPSLSNCYVPLSISTLRQQQQHVSISSSTTKSSSSTSTTRDILLKQIQLGQRDSGDSNSSNSTTTATTTTTNPTTRYNHSLRPVHIESGIFGNTTTRSNDTNDESVCDGSSLIEIGCTKVICQVIGPITASAATDIIPNAIAQQYYNMDEGFLYVDVNYASVSGIPLDTTVANTATSIVSMDTTTSSGSGAVSSTISTGRIQQIHSQQEKQLSRQIVTSLVPCIPLTKKEIYQKQGIVIKITVLQDDGSILPACITAATVALLDASIELYDTVTTCTVAIFVDNTTRIDTDDDKPNYYYLADPTLHESLYADGLITVSYLPNWKEISYWDITSGSNNKVLLPPTSTNTGTDLCYDGCRTFHKLIQEHFTSKNGQGSTER